MESSAQSKTRYIFKAVLFCIFFTVLFIILSFAKSFIPSHLERLAHGIIGTLAAFLTTFLFLRFDRKQFSDIRLTFNQNTVVKFFTGAVAGVVIMGLLVKSSMYFSHVRIEANSRSNFLHFLLMTLPLIPLAFMEELGFRAYPLEVLKGKIGIRLSIIITSILFALYHVVNGWTVASSFSGPAVWGLLLGLSAIYSKGIAMPTGFHYAINLTTSAFGTANNKISVWIIKQPDISSTKHQGADWATIFPTFILLIFALVCIELYVRRETTAGRVSKERKSLV